MKVDAGNVLRALENLERKVQRAIERRALRAAGRIVLHAVRESAPSRTGELKRSFKLRSKKRSRKSQGVVIVSSARHAWPVERGSKRGSGSIPATEFATKAFERAKDSALEAFKQSLREEL